MGCPILWASSLGPSSWGSCWLLSPQWSSLGPAAGALNSLIRERTACAAKCQKRALLFRKGRPPPGGPRGPASGPWAWLCLSSGSATSSLPRRPKPALQRALRQTRKTGFQRKKGKTSACPEIDFYLFFWLQFVLTGSEETCYSW